ncbi:MAG: hypothetical protein WCT77_07560 [Bacteroidota bacterium]
MWIEIFKTGTHSDSRGNTSDYSTETLDKIAEMYNTKVKESDSNEAPLVKGHPETNEPAYGWVERLSRRGNSLLAKLKEIEPELIAQVRKGMFKKVSIALEPDLNLRHIGLLGAIPPAVKGLANVAFSADTLYNEFESELLLYGSDEENGGIIELTEEEGDTKSNDNGNEKLNELIDELELLRINTDELISVNKILNDENTKLSSKNIEQSNEIEALKNEIEGKNKEKRIHDFNTYADSLMTNSQGSLITPSQRDLLIDLLEIAYQSDLRQGNGLEFSGEDTALNKVKTFVSTLKPVAFSGEFAKKQKSQQIYSDLNLSGRKISPERLQLHESALRLQEETPGLSYEDAVSLAHEI